MRAVRRQAGGPLCVADPLVATLEISVTFVVCEPIITVEKLGNASLAARLASMKRTSFLINTARGLIVDQDALKHVLVAGRIAGAGLDVFDPEQPLAEARTLKLPNVVLAPHSLSWISALPRSVLGASNRYARWCAARLPRSSSTGMCWIGPIFGPNSPVADDHLLRFTLF
jgi:phosphoglycerate dehydrogenase-like enzyme